MKLNNNSDHYQQMKATARAYATIRECSIQEAVYLLMPELWLRKTFPGVIFANTNLPENQFRMCSSKKEIDELPEDSIDVYKRNMIDRYISRPNATFKEGKYSVLDSFCYAKFASFYYLLPSSIKDESDDCQPTILVEELEGNHSYL